MTAALEHTYTFIRHIYDSNMLATFSIEGAATKVNDSYQVTKLHVHVFLFYDLQDELTLLQQRLPRINTLHYVQQEKLTSQTALNVFYYLNFNSKKMCIWDDDLFRTSTVVPVIFVTGIINSPYSFKQVMVKNQMTDSISWYVNHTIDINPSITLPPLHDLGKRTSS
jgi:hypothetical protein